MKVPLQAVGRTRPSGQPLGYLQSSVSPASFGAGVGQSLQQLGVNVQAAHAVTKQRDDQISKFQTLTNFSNFEQKVQEELFELKRNADPSGKGFADLAEQAYAKAENDFLALDVPEELREEFRFRSTEVKNRIIGDALEFQYKSGDTFFKQGVSDMYEKALRGLDPRTGGSAEQLDAWKARVYETIDTTDLADQEKAQLKRDVTRGMEGVAYRAAVKNATLSFNTPEGKRNARRQAISSIESGSREGNYGAMGPETSNGDRAYGRYQVMGNNIPAWTKEVLGRQMTPQEFLKDKNAQDTVFDAKFEQNVRRYGSEADAASVWFTGRPRSQVDPNTTDATRTSKGTRAGDYVSRFEAAMGQAASDELDSDPRYANVAYEDRIALRADVEREVASELGEAAKVQKQANDALINTLMNNIMSGTAGQMDIDNAVQRGVLSDYDARKKAQDALNTRDKDVRIFNEGVAKLNSEGAVWNPTSDDDKKRQNALVNMKDASGVSGLTRVGQMDQDYFNSAILPMAQRTGDIPTDLIGTLTGMVRSNNQSQALFALSALAQLEDADKRAYDFRTPEALAKDVSLYRQYKDLLPEDKLMETINGGNTQQERQAREILQAEAKDYLQKKEGGVATLSTLVDQVVGEMSPGWSTASRNQIPWAARALDAEFQAYFVDAYGRVGNVEKANVMATEALKKNWGTTQIGGKTLLMKYPPEKVGYRPIAGDYSWIDRQVRGELDLPDDETFELISDEQTEKEFKKWQTQGGQPPSYQVVTYDGNNVGRLRTAENGLPERRYFQPTAMDYQREEMDFSRKQLEYEYVRATQELLKAQELERRTGVPVPEEFIEQEQILREQWNNRSVDTMLEGMDKLFEKDAPARQERQQRRTEEIVGPGMANSPLMQEPQ